MVLALACIVLTEIRQYMTVIHSGSSAHSTVEPPIGSTDLSHQRFQTAAPTFLACTRLVFLPYSLQPPFLASDNVITPERIITSPRAHEFFPLASINPTILVYLSLVMFKTV